MNIFAKPVPCPETAQSMRGGSALAGRVGNACHLDLPTYSFDSHLLRGRNEREVPVFVTYRVTPGGFTNDSDQLEIVSVKGADDLNTYEWDQIEQEAADDYAERDADLEAAVSYSRVAPL